MLIKRRDINIIGTMVLAALVAVVLLSLNSASADQSEATYEGSDACLVVCHGTQFDNWNATSHGIDFATEWYRDDVLTNKYTYSDGSCASCHVIGYNQTDKGGYDPAYAWNSDENSHLLRIGCENCHGPGSEHIISDSDDKTTTINQLVDQYSESCAGTTDGACHGGYRQYGNDTILGWSRTAHAEEAPEYAQQLDCSHCMSTEGAIATMEGTPLTELPESVTWKQTCTACHDPHPDETNTNNYQLRVSEEIICEQCHYTTSELGDEELHHPTKEMREGTVGIGVTATSYMPDVNCVECHHYNSPHGTDYSEYKQGHSWAPQPEACVVCHDVDGTAPLYNVTTAQEEIDELHENFATTLATVSPNIETMKEKKAYADENNIWTTTGMNDTYYEALWNFGLATEDGSNGTHNPEYAEALMLDANTKALEVIAAVDSTPIPETPGFEAIAFIAALGIALIILRRRK